MIDQIAHDDVWPRDARHRYRVYLVRDGQPPEVVAAAPNAGGLGTALVTLHEDALAAGGHLWDDGRIGVLDALAGEWVVHPWPRRHP